MKEVRKETTYDIEFTIYYLEDVGMYKAKVADEFLRFTYSSERFAVKEAREKVRELYVEP